jgi:hypothetical protein
MKALFITLLLLFITTPPSFAAPPTTNRIYVHKQKIVYTAFTNIGFIIFECLWSPARQTLVAGTARNVEFNRNPEGAPVGTIQVRILSRRTRRWEFERYGPRATAIGIAATFNFYPVLYHGTAYPLPRGSLAPGSRAISPDAYNLWHIRNSVASNGDIRSSYEAPIAINYLFMTVLPTSVERLDMETEQTLQSRGIDVFLLQPPRSSIGPCLRPLPQLAPRIWTHLLTNTVDEYQPGDIRCDPAPANPDPKRRPNTSGSCRPDACLYPRGPDDQGDPGDQREGKRQRFDLNNPPEEQCEAGGSNQGANDLRGGVDGVTYTLGLPKDDSAHIGFYGDSDPYWFIARIFWGPLLFPLWEYWIAPTGVETPGPLKTLGKMVCYEVLRRGAESIHDELR